MLGAILGDIIGSRFEFDRGGLTKKFKLFTKDDDFTDDTVMTVAVAEALLKSGKDADAETIKKNCIECMQSWGRRYPNAGYGGRFIHWVFARNPQPYNSFGNGSAMRVSAVGLLYDSLERTREVARATAEVSHNHPEGIKGAECTAAVQFLARTGVSKEDIKKYVEEEFGYDMSKSVDELRHYHHHEETCMDSLPKALVSFMEGNSYEDVVRNAVSLGGDTDTLAAIAGAMAEAMYDVPEELREEGRKYLPEDIDKMLFTFYANKHAWTCTSTQYPYSKFIKQAIANFVVEQNQETWADILMTLHHGVLADVEVSALMEDVNHLWDSIDPTTLKEGDTISFDQDLRLRISTISDADGRVFVPLFSDEMESKKGEGSRITMNVPLINVLYAACADDVEGLVINPFGQYVTFAKEAIRMVVDMIEKNKENQS